MKFGIEMTLKQVEENPMAADIFETFLPGVRERVGANPRAAGLSIKKAVKYMNGSFPDSVLSEMDMELQKLNTAENKITLAEVKQMAVFQKLDAADKAKPKKKEEHWQNAVYPGQIWLDTKGERIQAHGGAVFYENGTYYWYGENKEYTNGQNGVWTWGIRAYCSTDLCNWKDLGLIIPPVLDDPDSSLYPARYIDRPHILYCRKSRKYVCWIKLSGAEAAFVILEAESLLGPYTLIEEFYRPGGLEAGDFDLVCDEKANKAYLYFEANHDLIVCMQLSEDYRKAEKKISTQYKGLKPPFTREAPALFEADGKKYMITSGMTGYIPNRSDCAGSNDWEKPFCSIGNPHISDLSDASFNSQISKIFPVEGTRDLFIAMGDRWVPEYLLDAKLADVFTRAVASHYNPEDYQVTEEEQKIFDESPDLEAANTSIADYVWLPVRIVDGKAEIRWYDVWTVDALIHEIQ